MLRLEARGIFLQYSTETKFSSWEKSTSYLMGTGRISDVAELTECHVTLTIYTHRVASVRSLPYAFIACTVTTSLYIFYYKILVTPQNFAFSSNLTTLSLF